MPAILHQNMQSLFFDILNVCLQNSFKLDARSQNENEESKQWDINTFVPWGQAASSMFSIFFCDSGPKKHTDKQSRITSQDRIFIWFCLSDTTVQVFRRYFHPSPFKVQSTSWSEEKETEKWWEKPFVQWPDSNFIPQNYNWFCSFTMLGKWISIHQCAFNT